MKQLSLTSLSIWMLLLISSFQVYVCKVHADTWIDITDTYIQNAHYENNTNIGWLGTSLSFASPKQNAEHYSKTFDSYQDLTGLPAGTYRLSLKAFYRAGNSTSDWNHYNNNETQYQYAKLYSKSSANEYSTPIVFCSTAALSSSLGGSTSSVNGGTLYLPNNMVAAHYWFEAGYYNNTLNGITVGSDGKLRIGIRKTQTINADWTCITDWKLEYYGTIQLIQSITLPSSISIGLADTYQLTPTITPSDATYQKLTWASSKESVVTVSSDGLLTAVGVGSATITATATDGTGKCAQCVATVSNQGGDASSLIINEIMPANLDLFIDPSWNYGGFMELYNPTSKPASIAYYYLSDDPSNLMKWHIPLSVGSVPAQGYKTIWFDHNDQYYPTQCSFKLDVEGGTIYISDSEGQLICSQTYPASFRRCSYARKTDGGSDWAWTGNPTPSATNAYSKWASEQLELPAVSHEGQVFTSSLQVTVTIPSGATLRYTTDGSIPTLTNGATSTTGQFTVSSSTSYRFRIFKDGYLPSDIKTCSYIKKEYDYCAPIISVVTDNANIYGADYGIFVTGNGNGRSGRGSSSAANWNMEWDRPVSIEYIPDGGEVSVAQEVNMSAVGGWSRGWTPHSFKLKANKQYGLNYLPYTFFDNKPYIKNKTLHIRNGGNDNSCRIIDPCIQTIVARSGIDIDCQSYKPVFVYINGKFYSTLNMREPNNKHFAYANRGIDDEEMDQFEYSPDSAYVQMAGTRDAFELWYNLSADAADNGVYEQIKQIVDIDEFINYFAVEMYIGCGDWINNSNNLKAYRPSDGKFRFVMFDTDSYGGTSQFYNVQNTNWQTLDYIYDIGGSLYKEVEITTIWLNMLQNAEFRKQFTDTFCLVAGSVFEPTRCQEIINELATNAYNAMSQHGGSPWSSANSMISTFSSSRQTTMVNNMKSYSPMELSSATSVTATLSSNISEGKLSVNGLPIPTDKFSGTLFLPITLKAEAPSGYRFLGWQGNGSQSTTTQTLFSTASSWKYYDQGSLDGTAWNQPTYSSSWSEGAAPLGYATGTTHSGFNTTMSYGNNSSQKHTTYYLRKTVNISDDISSYDSFTLSFTVDDGCIVYVNGTEAGRFNMPTGEVTFSTLSSTWSDGMAFPQTITIPKSLMHQGDNLIAVEMHNNSLNSSDVYWDASMTASKTSDSQSAYVSTSPEYQLTASATLTACFAPLDDKDMLADIATPIKVNEISASNDIYINDYFKKSDWIELYNNTSSEIDVAGLYVSDNINQPLKYQISTTSPVNTLIPAHGHLILWADKLTSESQLHTTFKLANDDSCMVLITSSDEFIAANQAYFNSHPRLQDFADALTYVSHAGDHTVGRYPDGSNTFYLMSLTTPGKTNTLSTYDSATGHDTGIMKPATEEFELELAEGWNWISHPMDDDILVSQFADHAINILSQTQSAIRDSKYGLVGNLTRLNTSELYKIQTDQEATYNFSGSTYTPDIQLATGWNWISYPVTTYQTLTKALSNYSAQEGEMLVGQDGFATYHSGAWSGTLTTLQPGKGYMMKAQTDKQLTFNQSASVHIRLNHLHRQTANNQQTQSQYAESTANCHDYPEVMGIIARLIVDDTDTQPDMYTLNVTCDGQCRGSGQYLDNLIFINVYGQSGDRLNITATDQFGTRWETDAIQTFKSDVVGTVDNPLIVRIKTDGTTPVTINADDNNHGSVHCVAYFTIDGRQLTAPANGITIRRTTYNDGHTETTKIVKK